MSARPPPTKVRSTFGFLSLRWKILLILGGVMLSVNGALSWLHFHDLTTRFEVQRTATRERLVEQAFALRTDFGLRLQALAGMLAALDSVGVESFSDAGRQCLAATALRQLLVSAATRSWAGLAAGLRAKWSHPWRAGAPMHLSRTKQDAQVRDVIGQERAMHWTRCEQLCTQFAAAPILVAGRVAGAVVLGTSLADVVVSFHRLSGADLGVLVPVARAGRQECTVCPGPAGDRFEQCGAQPALAAAVDGASAAAW
jgi:hypothetical protein